MCSPGERGFADNLGEESWVSVPSREGSAASVLASPWGPTGREISGLCPCAKSLGGIYARVPGVGWRWVKWAPGGQPNHYRGRWVSSSGRNTEPCSAALLPALQTLHIAPCYQIPKCCSEACSAVFCPVWGPACFAGAAHPAAAAAGPMASWHLRVRYRSRAPGLKSTMGKCPVDF